MRRACTGTPVCRHTVNNQPGDKWQARGKDMRVCMGVPVKVSFADFGSGSNQSSVGGCRRSGRRRCAAARRRRRSRRWSSGRGLHSFPFHLNLTSSVHRMTKVTHECVLELLKLSSNVNECKPLRSGAPRSCSRRGLTHAASFPSATLEPFMMLVSPGVE